MVDGDPFYAPNLDWDGNKFCDCWTLEPCCGEPCNLKDGCWCFWCWTLCFWCTQAKLLATETDHSECAVVQHCCVPFWATVCSYIPLLIFVIIVDTIITAIGAVLAFILGLLFCVGWVVDIFVFLIIVVLWFFFLWLSFLWIVTIVHRHNVRSRARYGSSKLWLADVVMGLIRCLMPCAWFQICRQVAVRDWDWVADVQENGLNLMNADWKYVVHTV